MFSPELLDLSERLVDMARRRGWHITCAESCTGGLIAAAITQIPGSSAVFDRGYVTYHNNAKVSLLGVDIDSLKKYGAVSEAVARVMAEGALATSGADLALAATGIAGPGGGTEQKPVGLVYLAASWREGGDMIETLCERVQFSGDRGEIRLQAVGHVLALGLKAGA